VTLVDDEDNDAHAPIQCANCGFLELHAIKKKSRPAPLQGGFDECCRNQLAT
jgi:hypothetical protein